MMECNKDMNLKAENGLINCAHCRYYCPIRSGSFLELAEPDHEGICRHPQGCIATDPWGYCHYALRKEDVPEEDPES